MPQPCQALHGLLKAIVREYRRILVAALRASTCTALPRSAVFAGRQAILTCWWP